MVKRIKQGFSRIHLVDKCLIIFMIVLLGQSAYGMFFLDGDGNDASYIDVIVRTASASIFGYFLSANFISHGSGGTQKNEKSLNQNQRNITTALGGTNSIQGHVGFEVENAGKESQVLQQGEITFLENQNEEVNQTTASHLQIIAATGVGLFCLISLMILRDVIHGYEGRAFTGSVVATVTQFRDFISGCVGFLIGCPTRSTK